jgi:hypothetical protein
MAENPDPLTREELASLRELAKELLATEVPPQHTDKLFRLGLITKRSFEYRLTDAGKRLLAGGRS